MLSVDGDEICLSVKRLSSLRGLLIVPDVESDSCLSVLYRREGGLPGVSNER